MTKEEEYKDAIEFLLELMPDWVITVPKRALPMMYGTLSYDGDMKVKKKVDRIRKLINSGSCND